MADHQQVVARRHRGGEAADDVDHAALGRVKVLGGDEVAAAEVEGRARGQLRRLGDELDVGSPLQI